MCASRFKDYKKRFLICIDAKGMGLGVRVGVGVQSNDSISNHGFGENFDDPCCAAEC